MKDLEEALYKAKKVSAASENRGMASVKIHYHPYEAKWCIECSWSDNSHLECAHNDAFTAVRIMCDMLDAEYNEQMQKAQLEHNWGKIDY